MGYRIRAVDVWAFIWLLVILKIPIVALFLIVRWAVRQTPEAARASDGGVGPAPRPRHPHRPRGTAARAAPARPARRPRLLAPARVRRATIAQRRSSAPGR